jgi:hypothetical protein
MVMKSRKPQHLITVAAGLVASGAMVAGCGPARFDANAERNSPGIETSRRKLSTPTSVTFGSTAGQLDIVADPSGGLVILLKHPATGAILVNDVPTSHVSTGVLATPSNVKRITFTQPQTGQADALTVDFSNGVFTPGSASAPGLVVNFSDGADEFTMRGTSSADTITMGTAGPLDDLLSFNSDALEDVSIHFTGSVAYTVALGAGADAFDGSTNVVARLGPGVAPLQTAVTVYGGLGNDRFQGGAGDDIFYGEEGSDTLQGGATADGDDDFHGGTAALGSVNVEIDVADYSLRGAAAHSLWFTPDDIANDGADLDDDGVKGVGDELDNIRSDVESIKGGAANDRYQAVAGQTSGVRFSGGAAVDVVSYANAAGAVTVTMGDKLANDGLSGQQDDIRDDVEDVVCPDSAHQCSVTGNALDNRFWVLSGSTAANQFSGLVGVDSVVFSLFAAPVSVTIDFSSSPTNNLKIDTDVENVVCPAPDDSGANSSDFACTVVGNGRNNRITCAHGSKGSPVAAACTVNAGAGDDYVENDLAGDVITCGIGADLHTGSGANAAADCEL